MGGTGWPSQGQGLSPPAHALPPRRAHERSRSLNSQKAKLETLETLHGYEATRACGRAVLTAEGPVQHDRTCGQERRLGHRATTRQPQGEGRHPDYARSRGARFIVKHLPWRRSRSARSPMLSGTWKKGRQNPDQETRMKWALDQRRKST
jgi:hypothetical protein